MNETILSGIQAILAPALGISATALLLLSMQNRYSSIITRIRLLTEERRRYHVKIAKNEEPGVYETLRYSSIANQIDKMFVRCRELRNSIIFIQGSIMMFVITSILISINIFYTPAFLKMMPLIVFSTGLVFVLIGVYYSAKDVIHLYRVTDIEVNGDV